MEEQNKEMDQDFFRGLKEKYAKVMDLLDEKDNDESQPYRNKYPALEILKSLRDTLQNSEETNSNIAALLGIVYLNLGIVSIETEELKSGEEHLMNCVRTLEGKEAEPECILPAISALNQLGILWSRRDQPAKAKSFLEHAKQIYKEYKEAKTVDPVSMAALFGVKDEQEVDPKETVEKLYTLTLYYLAQIHGTLENYFESAIYCHETLSRQLEHKDFDMVEWALNAATLSQFFMEKGSFSHARHHLGAAIYTLESRREVLEKNDKDGNGSAELRAAMWENFKHRSADVARCWSKYGISLLSTSRERLVKNTENDQEDLSLKMSAIAVDSSALKDLKFTAIEKDVDMLVADVSDQYLLDFNDARAMFLKIQHWLEDAKKFYTLENHASDYVQVMQDMSQGYKYLAFFEDDDTRRAKMHKRRIDILESLIKELNPKYYEAACREIWMELGEIYSELLDIKLDRLRSLEERPPPKMLMKVNELSTQSMKNFQSFIDSLTKEKNSKNAKTFPEEMTRPVLCAYFHLGRLHNAFITPDKKMQLENVKRSLDAYKYLINYCEENPKARDEMIEELSICKELEKLLPLKIIKLKEECGGP